MDVWKTMFAGGFCQDKYLYHYTSIDSAIKIICSDKLLLSPISKTNDTSEAKMKLVFDAPPGMGEAEFQEKTEKIKSYFKNQQPHIRIMCLSTDAQIPPGDYEKALAAMTHKMRFFDFMGRGFALPRMWAQYARDNTGICFILDKEKLLSRVERLFPVHMKRSVEYKSFFESYRITPDYMEELSERIDMGGNGTLTLMSILQNNRDFVEFNFFAKLDDWANEHEFRIIALADYADSTVYVDKLSTYLCGVVVGEKIDPNYEKIIALLLQASGITCDVKKIYFESNCCRIK